MSASLRYFVLVLFGFLFTTNISTASLHAQTYNWTKQLEAKLEGGSFSEFTDTSILNGTLSVVSTPVSAVDGLRYAEAYLNGTGSNAYDGVVSGRDYVIWLNNFSR